MKMRISEVILFQITILFNYVHFKVAAISQTHIPSPSYSIPTIWKSDVNSIVSMSIYTTQVTFQAHIGASTKIWVSPSTNMNLTTMFLKPTTAEPKKSSIFKTTQTSSNIPISPSTSHPLLPSTSHIHPTSSLVSPTLKPPKTTSSSQPFVHKVGLIVGIVLGLVLISVCLIVFHKKETRIKCLKLICRPCRKNYRSRYNIVPIYVYDDTEQDIRELQDDSDLPLV